MRRWFYLPLLAILSHANVLAQTDVPYFEVIEGDSVKLFLESVSMFSSSRTSFTGKDCSRGYRVTRISADGRLDGRFADFISAGTNHKPTLVSQGRYENGKKEGSFSCYYPDGKLMLEGVYVNDVPSGEWKFYSDRQVLILVLRFDGGREPKVNYLYDDKAQLVLVNDGNGEARFVSHGEVPYAVSGRIRAGVPDGFWIGEMNVMGAGGVQSKWLRKETYREGKLVEAKRIQSGRTTDVCCTPELTRFFPTPEVLDWLYLEGFPVQPCPGQPTLIPPQDLPAPRSAVPVSDLYQFQSSVKSIILSKYQGRQVGESYDATGLNSEENQLVMHFDTNEKGRPVKIRLISSYGREFFPPIKRALESQTTWSPNQTKLVLSVFIRMTPSTYGYRIAFALD